MPLREASRFGRDGIPPSTALIASVLREYQPLLNQQPWAYCGYAPLAPVDDVAPPAIHVNAIVDNAFRLDAAIGMERLSAIVTTGIRRSRFAPVVFWEVLHALAPGGLWIDIDDTASCTGSPLVATDYLAREYFASCLRRESRREHGSFLVQTLRKFAPSQLALHAGDTGWTFGILTAGASPRAAQMAEAILDLDLPSIEVIFCGPRPDDAPEDPRVRTIDLERPEPRGWITRKKNLLAAAARHENLCLLHDRYVITPDWAEALKGLGPSFSFVTFPQAFYADVDRRFAQRYADYQVLLQTTGLAQATESRIFAGDHIFYAPYDDFYETAFICGGLYVAKRCLWNSVRQEESLFHSEWEDVDFGLACQRRGMPHRVSTALVAESATPHPMALTRIHDLVEPNAPVRGRLHIVPDQEEAAARRPERFKPIFQSDRQTYYERVLRRFNAIPGLDAPLTGADVAACERLSDFWRVIDRRVRRQALRSRSEFAAVLHFLSDTIYNWPNCEVQAWLAANERAARRAGALHTAGTIVGWGTGSMFHANHHLIDRPLAFVIDSDPRKWESRIGNLAVKPPDALRDLDPGDTLVVVFSCFLDQIRAIVGELGPFEVLAAAEVVSERPFHPLTDMVGHFEEVERYYPVLFAPPCSDAA